MSFGQIAILSVIVGIFSTLGAVLAWASWYSQSDARGRVGRQHGVYPTGGGLITDDD